MPKPKVQEIFRDRHILVYDAPNEPEEFSREKLAALGGLRQLRNIQGTFDGILKSASTHQCDRHILSHC